MGSHAIIRLFNLGNNHDGSFRSYWLESDSHFIKFYCFNAYFKHGNEHSSYARFLQLKKEYPDISKKEASP